MNKDFKEAFEKTKIAGLIAAGALDEVNKIVKAGVSTDKIDKVCYEYINDHQAYSAPLFYRGFPKSCCTSPNHVVCHGIPSNKILKDGDIVNVDVTAFKDGWHGDTSRMFKIGEISIKAENLINTTYEAMMKAISIVKDGVHLGDIGSTIQQHVEKKGFSVVQDFCGHGIGETFHKEPNILHYGKKGDGEMIKAGMIFTIEPMINFGNYETKILNDGWTAVTRDKSLSAQFEHTIGVTKNGCEVFTQSNKTI
ncbi:MAG: type I methionyl aminopeptidase [Candidatus Pelagibacter bacterium]|nr:type I methionyl aminopeptidase [Candidatus Pelagibacter bacterium]MBL6860925.1 type I methionyl aminopeptidase [Candidatus Pelagibacter bacterium]